MQICKTTSRLTKMLPMGSLFLLKRFLFSREVQKGMKELVFLIVILLHCGEGDAHVENPYFHIMNEKVWS